VLSLAVVILVQHIADTQKNNHTSSDDSKNNKKMARSLFKSTSNLSLPMMCSKTLRVDTTRATESDEYSWFMVMVPLGVYLGVFAVTTLFVFVISVPAEMFLIFTLSGLFICGVCTAVASSGIVGTAGLFDANIGVNPYFNGQAVGGLLVACANFLASVLNGSANFLLQYCTHSSSATPSRTEDSLETGACIPYSEASWATAGYFGMSCVVLAACMVGYSYVDQYKRLVRANSLMEDPLYSSVDLDADQADDDDDDDDDEDDNDEITNGVNSINHTPHIQYLSIENVPETDQEPSNNESTLSKWKRKAMVSFASYQNSSGRLPLEYEKELERQESESSVDNHSENSHSVTMSVWLSVQGTALSLFFTYFCTLAIFPVWTSSLVSTFECQSSARIQNDLFTPLSFVIFNGGDLVGRSISSSVKFEKIKNLSSKLVWGSLFRMVFFLFFLLCNAQNNRHSYWVVESDFYSWTVQFLFAVSNGFLTNIAFCYAPSLVENRTHPQQVASAILNFALSFGLLVGSFISGPFLKFAAGI